MVLSKGKEDYLGNITGRKHFEISKQTRSLLSTFPEVFMLDIKQYDQPDFYEFCKRFVTVGSTVHEYSCCERIAMMTAKPVIDEKICWMFATSGLFEI